MGADDWGTAETGARRVLSKCTVLASSPGPPEGGTPNCGAPGEIVAEQDSKGIKPNQGVGAWPICQTKWKKAFPARRKEYLVGSHFKTSVRVRLTVKIRPSFL
jgi:hypothetical protein